MTRTAEWMERQRGYGKAAYNRMRKDPEKWAAYKAKKRAAWHKQHEKELEKTRQWRHANPEKVAAYKRRYYRKHVEEVRAKNRARYLRDRVKRLAAQKKWREDNPEIARERSLKRYRENLAERRAWSREYRYRNRPSAMMSTCRKAAKAQNVPFDLNREWFQERITNGVCELSGLPFDLVTRGNLGGRNPNAPSIDRMDPRGGYTKQNCRMILWWLNRTLINLGDAYALSVFRAIFVRRGEMLPMNDVKIAA